MRRPGLLACGLTVLLAVWLAPATVALAAAPAVAAAPAPASAPATAPAPAVAATTATTDEVLAKLAKNEPDVKTFEADMKMTSKGGGAASDMTGHIAWQAVLKDGKRTGMLMNMKHKMTMGQMGEMNVLMVNDGEFNWSETRYPQVGVMVTKNRPDASKQPTGDTQLFRDQYDLKLVGEEEFDGQTMWVLEGTKKAAAAPAAGGMGQAVETEKGRVIIGQAEPEKIRVYIGQKDFMCHRYRTFDKAGNEMMDMQFTSVKVNGKLDAALFKYTPPADARVMDMTKGMPNIGDMMKNLPKQ